MMLFDGSSVPGPSGEEPVFDYEPEPEDAETDLEERARTWGALHSQPAVATAITMMGDGLATELAQAWLAGYTAAQRDR